MLSTRPATDLATPSRSLSCNPTIHPDSVALLKTRVPPGLHSVLTQFIFSESQIPEQSRRLRRLLALERDGALIAFLEQQPYAPAEIYDFYATAPAANPVVRSVTTRRRRITVRDENKPYTSSEPLPPEAQRRIRAALQVYGGVEPNRYSAPPVFRADYMFSESIPDSLETPALVEWLRTQATP